MSKYDKLMTIKGKRIYYLDDYSKSVLPESLHDQADWLIHIGRYIPKNSTAPNEEKKEVARFILKLESAIQVYSDLAPNNQARILNFEAKNMLNEILESAKVVDSEPLPKKTKLENLYNIFYTMQHPDFGSKKITNRDGNWNIFQTFMGVVIKHVSEESEGVLDVECEDVRLGTYIERAIKQYKATISDRQKIM